jgi:hypothetical protein
VVVWEDRSSGVVEVHGQRFDPAGAPLGGEFPVKAVTGAPSIGPAIASDAAGDFVVAWVYADTQLLARRFDASGAPRGPAFVVTPAPVAAVKPSIASDPVGNLFITWTAPGPSGLDVRARRFGGLRPTALRVDTSGNGIFEPGETVDLRPTWLNFNGATLTVAAGASRFTGPPEGGVSYTLADASGDYGTLADGASAECGDCYRVGLGFAGVRPALHWDATLDERITPDALGQTQRWRLHLGESFADVPRSSPFYRFVETLLHNRVTAGCTSTDYCPGASTRREQMAAFVLAAREGAGYAPAACGAPAFDDVPPTSPFCRWIEELARRGVVTGCSTSPPLYCPATAVSREQMAVFVLRALDPALNPPACTAGAEMFADVPASNAFCRWIEELARRGVVTGCASGLYCPGDPVTREQMAVFLGATFGLALYTI